MPSPIAHSISGYAIAKLWPDIRPRWPRRWLLFYTVFIAIATDLDFIPQFLTGIHFHHGFTHSISFTIGVTFLARSVAYRYHRQRAIQLGVLTLILYGSHLALDMVTQGGDGIQLLWPFSTDYYQASFFFFPATHWSQPLLQHPGHIIFLMFELGYTLFILMGVWLLQIKQKVKQQRLRNLRG